jgi:outer membrane protein assembly factor BamB
MNEHDLHGAFGDLARRGADDQAERMRRGAGIAAGDVVRRASRGRQRRAGASAVTGVVIVVGLVLGGSALTHRPDPQPADTPSPTVTGPAPAPSRTRAPAPTPTSEHTSSPPLPDPATDLATTGLLRPYPTEPSVTWTASGSSLWPSADGVEGPPTIGDVSASMHTLPPFRGLAAGTGLLVATGVPADEWVVGVDSRSGAVTWRSDGGADGVISCGGSYDDLLVCLGRRGTEAAADVQLRDPATGAVVRTVGPGGHGIVVVGDAVLVFDSDDTDVHLRTMDLASGAVRYESTLAGAARVDEPIGDGVIWWERAGSMVLVHGYGYTLAVDVADGSVLGQSLASLQAVRADGWVTGTGAGGSPRAVGPQGQDLLLPDPTVLPPVVWAPRVGSAVPLLAGSSPGDGKADRVSALDPVTGETLWTVPDVWAADGVVGDTALLRGDDLLLAVDVRTGAERWREDITCEVVGFDGDRVVVAAATGPHRVAAFDLEDGDEAWTKTLPADQVAKQIDGTLVLVGADGSLRAHQP